MQLQKVYTVGAMYSLDDIKPIVDQFKTVSSKKTQLGLVHLYKQKDTSLFWVNGPFQGRDTNCFIYLGVREATHHAGAEVLVKEVMSLVGQSLAEYVVARSYNLFNPFFDVTEIENFFEAKFFF